MDKLELKKVVTDIDSDQKANNQGEVCVEWNEQCVLNDEYSYQKPQKSAVSTNVKETCITIPDGKDVGGDINQNYKVKEHKDQRAYYDPNTRTAYISDGGAYQGRVVATEAPPPHADSTPYDVDSDRPRRRSRQYYREVIILFQDQSIRQDFIRKVYTILAVMLLYTFGFVALCIFEKYTRLWVLEHYYVSLIALGICFLTVIPLVCCNCARRVFPLNFLLLSLVTVSMSYSAAYISCYYDTKIVMSAFGGTALICIVVTFIAWQDWFDVTTWGMYLCIALSIVVIYGFVAAIVYIFTGSSILYLIYSCLACLLLSMFLMYDTQQIVGGKRIQLSTEEYILGALTLYIDIITIFILLVDIIQYCY